MFSVVPTNIIFLYSERKQIVILTFKEKVIMKVRLLKF